MTDARIETDPLLALRPSTLSVNQPNTQAEGAIKGKLRINDTGQQFDTMNVVFLSEPKLQRAYHTGAAGTMNRKAENLVCFSNDMIRPDKLAKQAQAITCDVCDKGDKCWEAFRLHPIRANAPPCDAYFKSTLIAKEYKLPLNLWVRSKMKKPFEAGIVAINRLILMNKAEGIDLRFCDIAFKLSTLKILTGTLPSWVISMTDFTVLTPELRADYGQLFEQYAAGTDILRKTPIRIARSTHEDEQSQIDDMAQDIQDVLAGVELEGEYMETIRP